MQISGSYDAKGSEKGCLKVKGINCHSLKILLTFLKLLTNLVT